MSTPSTNPPSSYTCAADTVARSIDSAVSLTASPPAFSSTYTACSVSLTPQLTTPSFTAGNTAFVTVTLSLRKIPVVSPLSVNTSVSVSSTSPAAPPPLPGVSFATYTVTTTVSLLCGFRFSSVSCTCTCSTSRT